MEKSTNNSGSRRAFLKGIGITAASLAVPIGTVGAESDSIDQIRGLLRSGDKVGANEVAQDEDVEYNWKTSEFYLPDTDDESQVTEDPSSDTPVISPDKIWTDPDKSSSRLSLGVYSKSAEYRQYAFMDWDLTLAGNHSIDSAGSKDGVSISYSNDVYTNLTGEQGGSPLVSEVTPKTLGVIGKFDDNEYLTGGAPDTPGTGWLDVVFQTKANEVGQLTAVYANYIHTWYPGGIPPNLGASYSLPSVGGLSVSASVGTESYPAQVMQNHTSNGQ